MSRKKIIFDETLVENACKKSREDIVSERDKRSFVDEMNKAIDEKLKEEAELARQPINNRKKRKSYIPVVSLVACAALCAVAVAGVMMNTLDPMVKEVAGDPQSTVAEQVTDGSINQAQDEVITTEEQIEYYKENDVNNIQKGKIVFSGGTKGKTYKNPTTITLENADIKAGTCSWTIKNYENDKTVYSGKEIVIKSQLKDMIKNKKDGSYIITYSYADKSGNELTLYEGFSIRTDK